MITTTLISPYHWKTFVPFYLQNKRPENAFLTLTVNYLKILQKNNLCYSKQHSLIITVLIQSLNKMHMKQVSHSKFRNDDIS